MSTALVNPRNISLPTVPIVLNETGLRSYLSQLVVTLESAYNGIFDNDDLLREAADTAQATADAISGTEFRSGDIMLSTNAAAPTGWSDVSVTYENKFIRISSGTPLDAGGSDTDSITLTATELPAHTHEKGTLAGAVAALTVEYYHNNGGDGATTIGWVSSPVLPLTGPQYNYTGAYQSLSGYIRVPAHAATISGTLASTGSGQAFTVDTVPAYIQLRMFQKD